MEYIFITLSYPKPRLVSQYPLCYRAQMRDRDKRTPTNKSFRRMAFGLVVIYNVIVAVVPSAFLDHEPLHGGILRLDVRITLDPLDFVIGTHPSSHLASSAWVVGVGGQGSAAQQGKDG
ncbi:hypothetical protein BBP40_000563 [Aspergillus hancockii]|nr:hypothetical protein BBP40_000563 [Aspergillus hancockii]